MGPQGGALGAGKSRQSDMRMGCAAASLAHGQRLYGNDCKILLCQHGSKVRGNHSTWTRYWVSLEQNFRRFPGLTCSQVDPLAALAAGILAGIPPAFGDLGGAGHQGIGHGHRSWVATC